MIVARLYLDGPELGRWLTVCFDYMAPAVSYCIEQLVPWWWH